MTLKLLFFAASTLAGLVLACGATDGSGSETSSGANDAGRDGEPTPPCATPGAVLRQENGDCKQSGGAWGAEEGSGGSLGLCCVFCKANEVALDGRRCRPRADAAAAGAACRLSLYPADYPARCQTQLDAICCGEEKACADDAACAQTVACLAKCPAPRTDACLNACAGSGTVPAAFQALGTCSKNPTLDPDGGSECSYP